MRRADQYVRWALASLGRASVDQAHHGPHHRRHRRRPVAWAPDGSGSRGRPSDDGAAPAFRRRAVPVHHQLSGRRRTSRSTSSRSRPASRRGCGRMAIGHAPTGGCAGLDVVHGTNYVAPPSRLPTVVSVYDLWFLANRSGSTAAVNRAGAVLRRAVKRGAFVHASSQATAEMARELLGDRPGRGRASRRLCHGRPVASRIPTSGSMVGRSSSRSARSSGASRCRRSSPRSATSPTASATACSSWPARPATTARGSRPRSTRCPPRVRSRVICPGPVERRAPRVGCSSARRCSCTPRSTRGSASRSSRRRPQARRSSPAGPGSIPEIGGEGVELVDGDDPAAYAAAIEHVVTSGIRRLTLLEAGLRNVARFTWDRTAAEMEALYRRAIAAGS